MKNPEIKKANTPFTLIIFGASGSLAKLKLFPSIYELAKEKRLPKDVQIVGYARTPMANKDFHEIFEKSIRKHEKFVDEKLLKSLLKKVHYVSGQYDQKEDFQNLKNEIKKVEKEKNRIRIAYFSVPPSIFDGIFTQLAEVNFNTRKAKLRLVIEKPFGYNLKSAKKLKKRLVQYFSNDQIYLLDHYLGKEAVSNLLGLRYANSIITSLMSNKYVSNIQISALEDRDIEGRGNYFDNVGVLRDMVQSHLLQILAYLTMYAPRETTAESIHKEKIKILRSIKVDPKSVVRGQYEGYQKEKGVMEGSQTETYSALKLCLRHPLWKGVPIYLRTGKALKQKWTAVVIEFKPRYSQRNHKDQLKPNRLVIQIQPYEKIEFHLLTKLGGQNFDFHDLTTGRPIYCSGDCLSEHGRLFVDVVNGDQSLFLSFDEIFAAWQVTDPLQKVCDRMKRKDCDPDTYKRKSMGPKSADEMIEKDGFTWFYSLPTREL
jgi:glucose-6-phosphate 1-dehydrogenase